MGINSFRQAKQRLIELIKFYKLKYDYNSSVGYQGIDDPLAKKLGIEIQEHKMDFDFGIYISTNNQSRSKPMIWLDPTSSDSEHLNFSFYHEISHHLIRNDNELYSFLSDLAYKNKDFENVVERFANIGAAEFLIPSEDVYSLLQERGFNIQLLPELDQYYPASKPAIVIQMAQCASHECFVVVCQYGILQNKNSSQEMLVKTKDDIKPKFYVQYSSSSPSLERYSIGKYSLIPKEHLFYQVYQSQKYLKGYDHIPFKNGNLKWVVDCEAIYYKGRVYGTFNNSKPSSKSVFQPNLF